MARRTRSTTPVRTDLARAIGGVVGSYQVLKRLGGTGTSSVFRGRHSVSGTLVAIKVAEGPGARERLSREVQTLEALGHPGHAGVIRMLDRDSAPEPLWYAMQELGSGFPSPSLPGADANAAARRLRAVSLLVYRLALALDYVHRRGFIHNDVSPHNVCLDAHGDPVIVDFGEATRVPWPGATVEPGPDPPRGTPGFASPERLRREGWDSRSDIYSLGCLWYSLWFGQPVFPAADENGLRLRHLHEVPVLPSARQTELAAELEAMLLATLEKQPQLRPARARAIADALAPHVSQVPPQLSAHPAFVFKPRLVGRAAARAQVSRRLETAQAGSPCLHWITGEAGVGLTRFVSTIQEEARGRGFRVLRSKAQTPVAFAHPLGVAESQGQLPLARAGEPVAKAAVERAFETLASAYGEAAAEGATLLILEGPTQVGPPVLAFLHWARHHDCLPPRSATLLVLDRASREALGVETLPRDPETSTLAPLGHSECSQLLADMLGTAPEPGLTEHVFEISLGTPGVIRDYVPWALATGRIQLDSGRARLGMGASKAGDIGDFVSPRLAGLSRESRLIASAAAMLGTRFDRSELVAFLRALAWEDAPLDNTLEYLQGKGLVDRSESTTYSFPSRAIRLGLMCIAPRQEREAMHALRARQLATGPRDAAGELAYHLRVAGQSLPALRAMRRAAHQSVRPLGERLLFMRWAWEQGSRAGAVGTASPLVQRSGFELLLLLSRAAQHESVWALGRRLLADRPRPTPLLAARAHRLMGLSCRMSGQYAACLAHYEQASRLLKKAPASSLAVQREMIELQIHRMRLSYVRGDVEHMWQILREVRPAVRRLGRAGQRADLCMDAANAVVSRRRYLFSRRAVALQRRAWRIHARHSPPGDHNALMAHFDLGFMLLLGNQDHCREALGVLDDAGSRAERYGEALLACRIDLYRAIAHRRLRQAEPCRLAAERTLGSARFLGLRGYEGAATACLAWVAYLAGRPEQTKRRVAEARRLWRAGERTDSERLSEYPFQWLAELPMLAVLFDEERYEECGPILSEVLHPAQARLHPSLGRALREASSCGELEIIVLARALERCLREAKSLGYL